MEFEEVKSLKEALEYNGAVRYKLCYENCSYPHLALFPGHTPHERVAWYPLFAHVRDNCENILMYGTGSVNVSMNGLSHVARSSSDSI